MSKIVIDARESGTSTGRYIDKLIEHLHKLPTTQRIVILTTEQRVNYFKKIAPHYGVVICPYREFSFGEQLGLAWQLYRLKADLVHFGMTQQPLLYFKKSVTTIHDLTTVRFKNPNTPWLIFKIKQQVYKIVIWWAAHKSARVITISQYVKKDICRFAHVNPRKITITYEAADKITEPAIALSQLAGQQYIMYVGRPQPHKNLQRLIQAFALAQKSVPELILVLVGKTDKTYRQLEQFARTQKISGVYFSGFVDDGELRWLYEQAAAYIFPSLSEGFGLPGLEAMQYGVPVVASKATSLPEIYKDAAEYFDPHSSQDMAAAILRVLASKRLSASLAVKGGQLVKTYSWTHTARQTLAVYQHVLKK